MVNIEKNKQFQETEARIEAIYRALRKDLPLEKVSVSRICKEAKINRSSFYYHYLDVYDLNDQLMKKMQTRLLDKLGKVEKELFSKENLQIFFQHIKDEKETYKLMTAVQIDFPIPRFYDQFKDFLLQIERYKKQSEEEIRLSIIYVQAGFHFMTRQWLADDCSMPVDQLVDLFLKELG